MRTCTLNVAASRSGSACMRALHGIRKYQLMFVYRFMSVICPILQFPSFRCVFLFSNMDVFGTTAHRSGPANDGLIELENLRIRGTCTVVQVLYAEPEVHITHCVPLLCTVYYAIHNSRDVESSMLMSYSEYITGTCTCMYCTCSGVLQYKASVSCMSMTGTRNVLLVLISRAPVQYGGSRASGVFTTSFFQPYIAASRVVQNVQEQKISFYHCIPFFLCCHKPRPMHV